MIRLRTQTTTWSRGRSIQPVVTEYSAPKKATGVCEVGWVCSNRRWFLTNNSPTPGGQERHSTAGPRHDPLPVSRLGSNTLLRTRSCGGNNPLPRWYTPSFRAIYRYLVLTCHAAWAHDLRIKLDQSEMEATRYVLCASPCINFRYRPSLTRYSQRLCGFAYMGDFISGRIPFSLSDQAMMTSRGDSKSMDRVCNGHAAAS